MEYTIIGTHRSRIWETNKE